MRFNTQQPADDCVPESRRQVIAIAALFVAQTLEWPGIPASPPGTTRLLRITYLSNPARTLIEELPTVPDPLSAFDVRYFQIVPTTKRNDFEWCVDASNIRIVSSATAQYREQTGLTRYVHYILGAGLRTASWDGCATGLRFDAPLPALYGELVSVAAFTSNPYPSRVALRGDGRAVWTMDGVMDRGFLPVYGSSRGADPVPAAIANLRGMLGLGAERLPSR